MKEVDKLIRNRIPSELDEKDIDFQVRELEDDEEINDYLVRKLLDEVDEFYETKELDELVDIFEALRALAFLHFERPIENIGGVARKKRREKGGFKDWIVLEEIEEEDE